MSEQQDGPAITGGDQRLSSMIDFGNSQIPLTIEPQRVIAGMVTLIHNDGTAVQYSFVERTPDGVTVNINNGRTGGRT